MMLLRRTVAVSVLCTVVPFTLAGGHEPWTGYGPEPCTETTLPPPVSETYSPPPAVPTITLTTTEICTVTETQPALPPSTVTCTETVTAPPSLSTVTRTDTVTTALPPSTATCTETVTAVPPALTVTLTTTATLNGPATPPPPPPPPGPTVTSTTTVTESQFNEPESTVFISVTATVELADGTSTFTETVTEIQAGASTVTLTTTTTESPEVVTLTVTETSPSASDLSPSTLLSLAEALVAAGCSNFLAFIQSNATVWDIFNSARTQTVFAPSDAFFSFSHANSSTYPSLRHRGDGDSGESLEDAANATYQAGKNLMHLSTIRTPSGFVVNTNLEAANLNGDTQHVVADSRDESATGSSPSKRSLLPRFGLHTRQNDNTTIGYQSLARLDSGLGDVTNVIDGNLAYTGGLIHVTDSLFTIPEKTLQTSVETGESTFADMAARANLTGLVDETPSITVFIPSNDAFLAANISPSTNVVDLARTLGGHVVQSTADNEQPLGYLPNLKEGLTLTTTTGSTLQITVIGQNYFVNDAMITKANLVLENGVAHIIDRVLGGTPTLPQTSGCAVSVVTTATATSSAVNITLSTTAAPTAYNTTYAPWSQVTAAAQPRQSGGLASFVSAIITAAVVVCCLS